MPTTAEDRDAWEIWYLLVGANSYELSVFVKPMDTVEDLTRAIQGSSSALELYELSQILLFLAKPESGDWLSTESQEFDALMAGDLPTADRMCGRVLDRSEILNECFDLENFGSLDIHVLVRVRPPTPAEIRRKRQKREDEVELWCLEIGDFNGAEFVVKVKRTDRVEDLQILLKKLLYREKMHIWFDMLHLYHARNDKGEVLQDSSPDVDALCRGEPDTVKSWLKHRLEPQMVIGDAFKAFDNGVIQVLLLPPKTFIIEEDSKDQQFAQPYRDTAKLLKHAPEVNQLVNVVRKAHAIGVEGKQAVPFVVLEGSSGSGKSQMAFNLMNRDEFALFCVVCGRRRRDVWRYFQFQSAVFLRCVQKDLELVGEAGVVDFSEHVELYTYTFIWAVVSRLREFTGPRTRGQVLEALEAWRKRQPEGSESKFCVFFLDDHRCLDGGGDPSEREASVRRLRFMRNVFRSVGLVVILSASQAVIRDLLDTVESTGDKSELWCYVVPLLSRFQNPWLEKLPQDLRTIIECSRPILAKLALDYARANPPDTNTSSSLAAYMDQMASAVLHGFAEWRSVVTNVNAGLVALCGGIEFGLSALIAGPLSRLFETKPFSLWRNSGEALTKRQDGDTPWTCGSVFAKPENDALMYLCFTGHKGFHELKYGQFIPTPFHDALIRAECGVDLGNMRQNALVAGAIVAASRWNGFAGIPFDMFLPALLHELGFQASRDTPMKFPKKIRCLANVNLPVLLPPPVEWPSKLKHKAMKLVTLKPVKKNNLIFIGETVSVACKLRRRRRSGTIMKDILRGIPKHTRIHLAVTDPSTHSYYTDFTQVFAAEVTLRPWLQRAIFYRVSYSGDKTTPELVPIPHQVEKCNAVDCKSGCKNADKLVVFLELAS